MQKSEVGQLTEAMNCSTCKQAVETGGETLHCLTWYCMRWRVLWALPAPLEFGLNLFSLIEEKVHFHQNWRLIPTLKQVEETKNKINKMKYKDVDVALLPPRIDSLLGP